MQELSEMLRAGGVRVLEVRRDAESHPRHIEHAQSEPSESFTRGLPTENSSLPLAVHCKSGYRSMIACSLLQRAGHANLINVVGGFDAWVAAGLPIKQ